MSTAWVVMVTTGEYSDTRVWPFRVCPDKETADGIAAKLTGLVAATRYEIESFCEASGIEQWEIWFEPNDSETGRRVTQWLAPFGAEDDRMFFTENPTFYVVEAATVRPGETG